MRLVCSRHWVLLNESLLGLCRSNYSVLLSPLWVQLVFAKRPPEIGLLLSMTVEDGVTSTQRWLMVLVTMLGHYTSHGHNWFSNLDLKLYLMPGRRISVQAKVELSSWVAVSDSAINRQWTLCEPVSSLVSFSTEYFNKLPFRPPPPIYNIWIQKAHFFSST